MFILILPLLPKDTYSRLNRDSFLFLDGPVFLDYLEVATAFIIPIDLVDKLPSQRYSADFFHIWVHIACALGM